MRIVKDDLQGPEIENLLATHLNNAAKHSPPESIHALDLDSIRNSEITFWSAWENKDLLACGALNEVEPGHGELKSMHTYDHHRGKGIASHIIAHLISEAKNRGYNRLSLETGSMDAYLPARRLYAKHGFVECEPFADYKLDPHSTFMTSRI